MFEFAKVRRFFPWQRSRVAWFQVRHEGRTIGYVCRQSPGRWAGETDRAKFEDQPLVVGPTRDAAANALLNRARALSEGTGAS